MISSKYTENPELSAARPGLSFGPTGPRPATIGQAATNPRSRNVRRPDILTGMPRAGAAEGDGGRPSAQQSESQTTASSPEHSAARIERFHALYRTHFDFVFRNLRRLGVPPAQVDDAVQDAFLVVLRHLDKYEPGSHSKAWLFAIAFRVARNYRRSQRRRDDRMAALVADGWPGPTEPTPFEGAAKAQAISALRKFLDQLDDDKRGVFIMTELEQMSAPEIAQALDLNVNTVYARIRAARREFARAIAKDGQEGDDDGHR